MTSRFSIDRVRELVHKRHNIRNLSVIAHVDHGKSTLTDSLLVKAGLMNEAKVGEVRALDTRDDEKERGVTIKSTGISLAFHIDQEDLKGPMIAPTISEAGQDTKGWFLINLIDSPGHVDFSSEVTAALRVTDGALVVVDCVEGVCVQTETVLRQSLTERVKPVLVINKIDRALVELKLTKEELYQRLLKVISEVNGVIETYQDATMGDLTLSPEKGNVAFACGKQGWAFTLHQFAKRYASKFGMDKTKLQDRLWGEHYMHSETKKWSKTEQENSERGFNKFVLEPIYQIFKRTLQQKQTFFEMQDIITKLDVTLTIEEQQLTESNLLKVIMRRFLPAGDALVEMAILHLPSPVVAQRYRLEKLYEGPLDDECAEAIRNCDADGPLMCYISKMIPSEQQGGGRFYAFGRVFSGKVRAGQLVRIQGPRYEPGKKSDLFEKPIQRVVLMMGKFVEAMDECPPGCIVGLVGIDSYLLKSGTLTTSENAFNFRVMKFSVSPVVQMAVEPKNQADLMSLVEGLKRLSKSDPLCQVSISESGEHIVAAAGELHLEICIHDLENIHAKVPLKKGNPVVGYRETVTEKSHITCLSKSPNKHNRIFMEAEPLSEALAQAIEFGDQIHATADPKSRAHYLADQHDWDISVAKKIWCFGPENVGTNLLVDCSKGVQYLHEIKDNMTAAFQWATKEGVLCEEPMRGCRFNIMDVVLHADAIHRGGGQIIPATRRVVHASFLTAQPALMEPVYLAEIQCSSTVLGGVYQTLNKRRGQLFSEEHRIGTPLCTIKAHLPVRESFGFTSDLRAATGGQAFPQLVFDHWKLMSHDLMMATNIVEGVRIRKGLAPKVPDLDHFFDRL